MENGENRSNIIIDDTATIGKDVKISDNVCILGKSVIGDGCEISSNSVIKDSHLGEGCIIVASHIEDSSLGKGCTVGPFAHIRANSKLGEKCRVGNFVEIKNSQIGNNSKMAHLAYIGDAIVGNNCNIGCGVVFCNYDGEKKQQSKLGDNVFVGSNANLVAPVSIADNAYIAAGSTINLDVGEGEFAIARERQTNKKNFKNPYIKSKN